MTLKAGSLKIAIFPDRYVTGVRAKNKNAHILRKL